jgi:type II secretory pathway pseudopilin PulG
MSAAGTGRATRGARAFSLVEMLLVIVLTVFGFMGILTLQVASIQSTNESKLRAQATNLAAHFIETVRYEALSWQNDTTLRWDDNAFRYLKYGGQGWRSGYLTAGGASTMVGPVGNGQFPGGGINPPVNGIDQGILSEMGAIPASFCVYYRLTQLVTDNVLRLEVRVLFRRMNATWAGTNAKYALCNAGADMIEMIRDTANVGTVSMLTTLSKNLLGP